MNAPTLRLIADAERGRASGVELKSVALIGNYPPRRCGIATFTSDVREALVAADPELRCDVFAMTDTGAEYAYPPEVTCEIRQAETADYRAAAARLTELQPNVVCVQHEFGIFGGPAGDHLMMLLEAIDRPVVSTLHTVLEDPDADQRRAFERLLSRSARVVVMAERGREMLRRVWKVADEKIVVIPHGAPDRAFSETEPFKRKLGFEGRELLFTFGLLSPNKGIETVIRAMPEIVSARPDVLYAVLGATHPHLVAREGERYRESLIDLADELGVGDNVRFIDSYTDTPDLVDYLQAADIYVTPYLNAAQITSGTLSYAAAVGAAIISTPYWHAQELLADNHGRIAPFGDAGALAHQAIQLLSHPDEREALRRRTYEAGRATIWSAFAQTQLGVFTQVLTADRTERRRARQGSAPMRRPSPSLAGVLRMTDSCGMLQHSLYGLPDRRHGYCVDDNARALILMHRLPGPATGEHNALANTYAAFVQHAWNGDDECFRNFMSFERNWLERCGSQDSNGRAVWSVAVTAAEAAATDHRRWASSLIGQILPHLDAFDAARANAFVVLGLCAMLAREPGRDDLRAIVAGKSQRLADMLRVRKAQALPWFEKFLSYDNARLPEAVVRAGIVLDDDELKALGVEALEWLCAKQTSLLGNFLPIATADFGRPLDAGALFDQQPLESYATVDACEAAFAATADRKWIDEAERAYDWYLGRNDQGLRLEAGEGDCYDGLTWCGANENRGAESVLSFQLATCTLAKLTGLGGRRLKTAAD